MRKVTQQIAQAFIDGESKQVGNTSTDGKAIYLHGNKIAEKRNDTVSLTLAGVEYGDNTRTLKRLIDRFGQCIGIQSKKGKPYFDGKLIHDEQWVDVA